MVEDSRTHGLLSEKSTAASANEQRKGSREQQEVVTQVSPTLEGKSTETRMSSSVNKKVGQAGVEVSKTSVRVSSGG